MTEMLPYSHLDGVDMTDPRTVRLHWEGDRNTDAIWNEICIWAIEQFGLPGQKFTWHPTEDFMDFKFEDERDALVFLLRWS
jgi:hypothetical protein